MTTTDKFHISGALQDYLEAIYFLSTQKSNVRITDIALRLGISKPSVNRAVNTLKKMNLVSHEPYGEILLTDEGQALGCDIFEKRTHIKRFLSDVLHLGDNDAEREAALIDHSISKNTVDKMIEFMETANG